VPLGTLVPGDQIMVYAIFDVDFMQQGGVRRPDQRGMRNTTVFRYHAEAPTAQLFLTQAFVALLPNSVITTNGTAFRIASPSGQNDILPDDVLQLQQGARTRPLQQCPAVQPLHPDLCRLAGGFALGVRPGRAGPCVGAPRR